MGRARSAPGPLYQPLIGRNHTYTSRTSEQAVITDNKVK